MWLDDQPTALYRFFDEGGTLLYVGITANLESRWLDHERTQPWWPQVTRKTAEWFDTRPPAAATEMRAVREEHPVHNVTGKPWSLTRRPLTPDEQPMGRVRDRLGEFCKRTQHLGQATFIVDRAHKRNRIAVIVPFDFYERACAALGEERVLVAKPES